MGLAVLAGLVGVQLAPRHADHLVGAGHVAGLQQDMEARATRISSTSLCLLHFAAHMQRLNASVHSPARDTATCNAICQLSSHVWEGTRAASEHVLSAHGARAACDAVLLGDARLDGVPLGWAAGAAAAGRAGDVGRLEGVRGSDVSWFMQSTEVLPQRQ